MKTHDKRQARATAWRFKGNAQVAEQIVGPASLSALAKPNRFMLRFRESNKGRRIA